MKILQSFFVLLIFLLRFSELSAQQPLTLLNEFSDSTFIYSHSDTTFSNRMGTPFMEVRFTDSLQIDSPFFSDYYCGEDVYMDSVLVDRHRYFANSTFAYRMSYHNGILVSCVYGYLNTDRNFRFDFHENGVLRSIQCIKADDNHPDLGYLEGTWMWFDSDGKLIGHEEYAHGKLIFKSL